MKTSYKYLITMNDTLTCLICCDDIATKECIHTSCKNGHIMCTSCFSDQVKDQISMQSICSFVENKCKIVCSYCKDSFNEKQIATYLNDDLYDKFISAKLEAQLGNEITNREKMLSQQKCNSKVELHRNYICENILTLHCKKCSAAFLDFTGCFAITCGSCNGSMCGWCLEDFSPDAHAHVASCKYSLNKGQVFSTLELFNQRHKIRRQNKIKQYLSNILDDNERIQLISTIKKDLEDLGIMVDNVDGNFIEDIENKVEEIESKLEEERKKSHNVEKEKKRLELANRQMDLLLAKQQSTIDNLKRQKVSNSSSTTKQLNISECVFNQFSEEEIAHIQKMFDKLPENELKKILEYFHNSLPQKQINILEKMLPVYQQNIHLPINLNDNIIYKNYIIHDNNLNYFNKYI